MNDFPLLTIITVTYNAEQFLERTLKSVQAALNLITEPQAVEYLIIDGKSSDHTLGIAKHFSFISKIVSEPDHGLYDAMNKGLANAKGKYVWFLNAGDEIYDANVLKNLLIAFKTSADIYYSDAMLVLETGREIGLRSQFTPHVLPKNLKWQDFALGMKVCHQAFIAKKAIAAAYDVQNLSADIDWEIKCLKSAKQVDFIPNPLCRYLLGGLSVKNHRRSLVDRFKVLRRHFGLLPSVYNHFRIFLRGALFARTHGKYW